MNKVVELYDTTLRDGAQAEGISFSVVDKLQIARKLDELGIHYVEGGWPGSNPKDAEFYQRARELKLKQARIVAFGSTRRAGTTAEEDNNLVMLVEAGVKYATLVAKSSEPQVHRVLKTTPEENLAMISDSIRYLKAKGIEVFFDAEHFFDGFKANPEYALKTLEVAAESGAVCLVLCDTNGGALPEEITQATKAALKVGAPLGIHTHNDGGLALANAMAAVSAGAVHVQGTMNGYGERTGNTDLCAVIPTLKLKMGINCVSDEQLSTLTDVSRVISDIANLAPDPYAPYVGTSAFSHKAGYHMDGIMKWPGAYQHIEPETVGNQLRTVISDQSGKRNVMHKAEELGIHLEKDAEETQALVKQIKYLESRGFQYDNAEASFELLLNRARPDYRKPFELVDFMVVVESSRRPSTRNNDDDDMLSEAMVKVKINGEIFHTAAEGDGPVNALDRAMRKALCQYYPSLEQVKLIDYKVRILEESTGTESQVRVVIGSSDGTSEWRTVGGSTNIIEASWLALADSLEYWLFKQGKD